MCAGALHSFAGLDAQIRGLCSSWQWQPEDRILHTLPLHHIHGIVNAAFSPLAVGACVEFQPNFSPTNVWEALKVRHAAVRACCHRGGGIPNETFILEIRLVITFS